MSNDISQTVKSFYELNRRAVDEEGIKIPHLVWQKDGGITIEALAISPDAVYIHVARVLIRERPDELIFGMDRWTKPGQGVDTDDCLSVSYWNGTAWRFGVIPYQYEPALFGEIDWSNAHWMAGLAREMTSSWGNIQNAPHREPSPAMSLPLQIVAPAAAASDKGDA